MEGPQGKRITRRSILIVGRNVEERRGGEENAAEAAILSSSPVLEGGGRLRKIIQFSERGEAATGSSSPVFTVFNYAPPRLASLARAFCRRCPPDKGARFHGYFTARRGNSYDECGLHNSSRYPIPTHTSPLSFPFHRGQK